MTGCVDCGKSIAGDQCLPCAIAEVEDRTWCERCATRLAEPRREWCQDCFCNYDPSDAELAAAGYLTYDPDDFPGWAENH